MLKVVFIGAPKDSIENHKHYDFADAVALTHEVEKEYRDQKENVAASFYVFSDEIPNLYNGTFNFGSYDYPNLYHQIKTLVPRIKVDKEQQENKLYLLEQIEKLTPEEFKREEQIDRTLINVDKTRISKLKKWQRNTIYSLTGLLLMSVIVLSALYITQMIKYEKALEDGRNQVSKNEKTIESYEYGLLGEEEEFLTSLESQKELTENQKRILASLYLDKSEYEKAVEVLDDAVYVETLLMKNKELSTEEKTKKIKEFNELFPTNEARFDVAYFEKDYELMLTLPSVNMTLERSEMKTYGLMKLGKIDEAKVELNNNNNKQLTEKISSYEVLSAEIKVLDEKLAVENKDKKKNKKAIATITKELKAKKQELEAL